MKKSLALLAAGLWLLAYLLSPASARSLRLTDEPLTSAITGAVTAALAKSTADRIRGPALRILVPAYFYPAPADPNWRALAEAARRTALTVIVNPGSGPGQRLDRNYRVAINTLRGQGAAVIGYVHTRYAKRPITDVIADVDKYFEMYRLDGIFIDEMANQPTVSELIYYRRLYQHIKGLDRAYQVIGNPGTNTAPAILEAPAADIVVNFENSRATYLSYQVWQSARKFDANKFAHLIYATDGEPAMRAAIVTAQARNAKMVFVTNDGMSNPWDSLPTYWNAQVDCVRRINHGQSC